LSAIVEQLAERERGHVGELLAGDLLEDRSDVVDLVLVLLVLGEDRVLRRLQHGVEAPDHDQRQDDLLVLRLLVVATQQLGDRPGERAVVIDRLRQGSSRMICLAGASVAMENLSQAGGMVDV
jgi:hypothetical protein